MKVGVFTPLLSQMPLEDVLNKLKGYNIDTVELGTGNYPGDAHCKLSMLEDKAALKDFKSKLADQGFSISALSWRVPFSTSMIDPSGARGAFARNLPGDIRAQFHFFDLADVG